MREIGWYDLLTRDRTVCRICHAAGQTGERMITDGSVIALRPRRKAAYVAKLKAALRRHISQAHPEWAGRVRWTK